MHQCILRLMNLIDDLVPYLRIHFKPGYGHHEPVDDWDRSIRSDRLRPGYERTVDPFDDRVQDIFLGFKMIIQSTARYTDSVEYVIGTGLIVSFCHKKLFCHIQNLFSPFRSFFDDSQLPYPSDPMIFYCVTVFYIY